MNWNKILIIGVIWLIQITRIMVVIAVFVLGYLIFTDNSTPLITLPLETGNIVESKPITIPSELMDQFEEVNVISRGYKLAIGVKGKLIWPYLAFLLISMGLYLYFATILLRFVSSSRKGDFFNVKNVARLRLIGLMLIGFDIFMWLLGNAGRKYFDRWFSDDSLHTGLSVQFVPYPFNNLIFLGLLVLVLAQAFDHGLKLRKEQELTI